MEISKAGYRVGALVVGGLALAGCFATINGSQFNEELGLFSYEGPFGETKYCRDKPKYNNCSAPVTLSAEGEIEPQYLIPQATIRTKLEEIGYPNIAAKGLNFISTPAPIRSNGRGGTELVPFVEIGNQEVTHNGSGLRMDHIAVVTCTKPSNGHYGTNVRIDAVESTFNDIFNATMHPTPYENEFGPVVCAERYDNMIGDYQVEITDIGILADTSTLVGGTGGSQEMFSDDLSYTIPWQPFVDKTAIKGLYNPNDELNVWVCSNEDEKPSQSGVKTVEELVQELDISKFDPRRNCFVRFASR